MYAYPVFPRQSATSTRLLMAPSAEAKRLETVESGRAKPNEEVLTEAGSFVSTNGGDPSDQLLVLAHCKLQFGKYQGQRFRWLLENSLGYAVYLVLSISKETAQKTPCQKINNCSCSTLLILERWQKKWRSMRGSRKCKQKPEQLETRAA